MTDSHETAGQPLKSRMLKCSCSCAAGYVCRTTRVHLERWGPPLCPACHAVMGTEYAGPMAQGMGDFLSGLHIGGPEAIGEVYSCDGAVRSLESEYVRIRVQRSCADCGRSHDAGAVMHYCVARTDGRLVRCWFCAEGCNAPVTFDTPGGKAPRNRITPEHATGDIGWSGAGHAEGFGTGVRS